MRSLVIFSLFLVIPYLFAEPLEVTVEEGQGFVLRMTHYEGYSDFILCQVEREHEHFNLSALRDPVTLPTGESLTTLFHHTNECGIRVRNVNQASAGKWKLIIFNEDGKFTTEATEIRVISKSEPRDVNVSHNVCYLPKDGRHTWECWQPNWYTDGRCFFSNDGVMDYRSFDLQQEKEHQKGDISKGVILKIEHSNILSCEGHHLPRIRHCRITHLPSGRTLNIQDGLQHQRYSAYKTDLEKKVCQLEIPNPIGEDTGIWKMTLISGVSREVHVCEFKLFDAERLKEELKREKIKEVDVLASDLRVTLTCAQDMPYPITMCLFQTHDKILFSHNQEELKQGTCRMQLLQSEIANSVTCGFNGFHKNDPDFYRRFEIKKHENELEMRQLYKKVLQCRHVFSESLEHCIFESPSKEIFSLSTDVFISDSFKYYNNDGQRMRNGFCTLSLTDREALEDGPWRCIAKKGQHIWQQEINICNNCPVNLVAQTLN